MAEKEKPSANEVRDFHTYDDLDSDPTAHHHTIGTGVNQAAGGAHDHDGANSVLLWEDVAITGSRSNGTALASVIQLLVAKGAVDNTTA